MPNPLSPPRIHLDANGILRFLLNDIPEQAAAVGARLVHAQAGRLIIEIHTLVIAEVVFVLTSFYRQPREQIVLRLVTLLNTPGIKVHEEPLVRKALTRYAERNVSFVDAFLATLGAETSHPIFSFDRGLDKFKDIRRVEK
jgi:predicted nucleic-acid-binding protein